MAREDAFQVEGVIAEALSDRTYRAVLANGHRVLAFVTGRMKRDLPGYAPGDKVKLQMSPYDLSEGRIIVETNK
jgi:translation initiation factor IF-1